MQKNCSIHEIRISLVCFHQGCTQPFLCRSCFKGHPDSHESSIKDLIDLSESKKWLDDKEASKALGLKEIEKIFEESEELRAVNESSLKEVVIYTKELLTQIERKWAQELDVFMTSGRHRQESEELFYALKKEMETLSLYNFMSDDIYEKIEKVKKFDDEVIPRVKALKDRAENALNNMRIGKDKVQIYKDAVMKIFNGVHIEDLIASRPFKNMEGSDKQNNDEIQNLMKENKTAENQIWQNSIGSEAQVNGENAVLMKQIAELKQQVETLRRICEEKSELQFQSERYNNQKDMELKELRMEMCRFNKLLAEKSAELEEERARRQGLEKLEKKEEETQRNLKAQNQDEYREIYALRQRVEETTMKYQKLSQESKILEEMVKGLREEVSKSQAIKHVMEEKIRALALENADLQEKLACYLKSKN